MSPWNRRPLVPASTAARTFGRAVTAGNAALRAFLLLLVAASFVVAQKPADPKPGPKPGPRSAADSKPTAPAKTADAPLPDDDPELPIKDLRAAKDARKRYVVIGPKKGAKKPADGWKVVYVLPGGGGGADFHGFVKNIARQVFADDALTVQLIAPQWMERQPIIWPTEGAKLKEAEFTTEEFFRAVHAEVAKAHALDPRCCFTLSWSSGGPAAYRLALMDKTPITGSYLAQSVFKPDELPSLDRAKGRAFFIDHSPDDTTCPFRMAEAARDALKKAGGAVDFVTYEGGHGWKGAIWDRLRQGRDFLTKNAKKPAAK